MIKNILGGLLITALFASCSNNTEKGRFTVTGELKNAPDGQVVLEELYFSQKPPIVLDSAAMKNGRFTLSATATEEGLYRIRTMQGNEGYILINDNPEIRFTADAKAPGISKQEVSGAANQSLHKMIIYSDSIQKMLSAGYDALAEMKKNNVKPGDSSFIAANAEFTRLKENLTQYCFQYADTAKSPVVAVFAATFAPVELMAFEAPLTRLKSRFPNHSGISGTLSFISEQIATKVNQQNQAQQGAVAIGIMAPELTMNDPNGRSFSLSSMRGKYVLIDFWASWCAPCRAENPNIVSAWNQFKDKNFAILGVSLDENKAAWVKAIADDQLTWQQISDLKYWSSAAVPLYSIEGIPFNVLIDPQGKIIAKDLRGPNLQAKLAEILQ